MLIHEIDGTRILFEDGPRDIIGGDGPVTFLPGWRPVLAYSGLLPVIIVPFAHEDGAVGCWFLDQELRRVGGSLGEIPPQLLADLTAALCPLLDGIWQQLVLQKTPEAITEAQRAFFDLPEHCRLALLDLYIGTLDLRRLPSGLDTVVRSPYGLAILDCGTRRVPLTSGELHWLSNPGLLQGLFDALPREGALRFRSPCDGSEIVCRKSLALDTDLIAYKLFDESWDLSVFLLAGGIYNRTLGLFFPEANLVISREPETLAASCPDLVTTMLRHLVLHGAALFPYLAAEASEPVHFWRGLAAVHLGHVLWNDYSGIARLLDAPGPVPRILVCDAGVAPEMYGPLDEVFPELQGRVRREHVPLSALLPSLYAENALLFRTSAMKVGRSLRDSILRPVPAVGSDSPVLLLGLRVENRTTTDLPGFCAALVAHLADGPGPVTLVVDGHNSRIEGGNIWSHGEFGATGSPLAEEQALLALIRERAAGTQVTVVDTLGQPIRASLAWARAARAFVAFWGAGLAKYRWVCNTPGLVITSRWNLENLNDLQIYSDPATMDAPSPVAFVSPGAVSDQPDAPVMISHGAAAPSLWNFNLDLPSVLADFDRMVAPLLYAPELVYAPAIEVVAVLPRERAKRSARARTPRRTAKGG
ncbi:hypothetical protein NFI95_05915 [Acetobacteraceae bacterium KSS8]|uniref:Uncharacterized protein n=1 Tax=Endosaccharibacter trunci TaxID=2812733 RepID=A0ABT1W6E8_9PROT|nr:hypothetical protein [Acetobacteraceae bacterium KSS8]